jgi:serine O-acetyltransferase
MFFKVLKQDYKHYIEGTFYINRNLVRANGLKKIIAALLDIDFRVVLYFRLSAFFWSKKQRFLALMIYFRIKSRYHCDLYPSAKIGPGLRLVHAFSIVVGGDVEIGCNAVIFSSVVLGKSRPDKSGSRMPTIGDNVLLGTGSKLLGDVFVPSGTLVPANAVITRSTFHVFKTIISSPIN